MSAPQGPPDPCNFFLKGHCMLKFSCSKNHNIQICPQGQLCLQKSSCQFRHVKLCPLFPKCGFINAAGTFTQFPTCSFYHPPPPSTTPSPHPEVTLDNRVSNLENLVHQLSTRLADVSAELDAVKKETTSKSNAKEKPTKSWWPFKFSEQQTGVTTENEINSGTDSEAGLNEGPLLQIFPLKDTSTQTAGESSTIMDINKLKTKVDNLEEIVRHQSDNYNLKTRVDNLEKLVRHQSNSTDSILAKTLENEIKQDLRQEMGRLKTDITDKVDRVGTELNSLVEKVTYMKASIKINSCRLQIISKATETWFNPAINNPMEMLGGFNGEIRNEERMLSELHPQIHKMVKEYQ